MFNLIRLFLFTYIPLSILMYSVFPAVGDAQIGFAFLSTLVFGIAFITIAITMKKHPRSGTYQAGGWMAAELITSFASMIFVSSPTPEEEAIFDEYVATVPPPVLLAVGVLGVAIFIFNIVAIIWAFNNASKLPENGTDI